MLSAIADSTGRTATIALRINPDVDAGTHAKITTGRADNKFGISYADAPALYAHAAALPGIDPAGIALHIGSQILSMTPYHAAYRRAADLVRALRAAGQTVRSSIAAAASASATATTRPRRPKPSPPPSAKPSAASTSRSPSSPAAGSPAPPACCSPPSSSARPPARRRFVVLDAAMNDLLRPAMYDSWHGIVPLSARDAVAPSTPCDIVGPVCETGDTFARARALPPLAPHAEVAILDAGAYGSVMSSTYNARPLAAQVLVDGARWAVIRDRGSRSKRYGSTKVSPNGWTEAHSAAGAAAPAACPGAGGVVGGADLARGLAGGRGAGGRCRRGAVRPARADIAADPLDPARRHHRRVRGVAVAGAVAAATGHRRRDRPAVGDQRRGSRIVRSRCWTIARPR